MKQYEGFKGDKWKNEIDVKQFILDNYTEYKGDENFRYMNEYAYPLNTIDKPQIMERILQWGKTHRIYGLGRWGEHSHFNSDVTVGRAMDLADRLL